MRVPLPDGQWADIADVVTHGREKAISRAAFAARVDLVKTPDIPTVIVAAFLLAWNVRDEAGHELPVTPEGIDGAPDAVIDVLLDAIRVLRTPATDPPNEKAAGS